MRKVVAGAVLAAGLATSAQASMISVTAFSMTEWTALTNKAYATEDFEQIGENLGEGELGGSLVTTTVGIFDSIAAPQTGGAGTCSAIGNDCKFLSLSKSSTFGQQNTVPDDGSWSLNTTDTAGIAWTAQRSNGGAFGSAIFVLTDAADIGNNVLRITTNADNQLSTFDLGEFGNAESNIFRIRFHVPVTVAQIDILTQNSATDPTLVTNDSMAFDGAALAPIPLPAAGWILLSGLVGLMAARRARRAA